MHYDDASQHHKPLVSLKTCGVIHEIQSKYMPICEPKEYEGVCLMVIWGKS